MTPSQVINQLMSWFFTSEDSRYGLSEMISLGHTSKDNIQNWVRRQLIGPDEATPGGRRVYRPLTVADLKVATGLVEMSMSPTTAFVTAHAVNLATLSWYAGRAWKDGDPMPAFNREIRDQFAVFWWEASSPHDDPEQHAHLNIVSRDDLSKQYFSRPVRKILTVVPIGTWWIDLAQHAQSLKLERATGGGEA